jgi:hypothetical protein
MRRVEVNPELILWAHERAGFERVESLKRAFANFSMDTRLVVRRTSRIEAATKIVGPIVDKLLVHELGSRRLAQLRDLLLPRLLSSNSEIEE